MMTVLLINLDLNYIKERDNARNFRSSPDSSLRASRV